MIDLCELFKRNGKTVPFPATNLKQMQVKCNTFAEIDVTFSPELQDQTHLSQILV